jgi:hypothetical protein
MEQIICNNISTCDKIDKIKCNNINCYRYANICECGIFYCNFHHKKKHLSELIPHKKTGSTCMEVLRNIIIRLFNF